MDSEEFPPARVSVGLGDSVKCGNCGSTSSSVACSSLLWQRSAKRKLDEFEGGNRFFIPGCDLISNAKVEIENECAALRERISSQQQTILDLYKDLEEERSASSSAASEAMSMILRLQREKAEVLMEARQFKSFAEDKLAHNQEEIYALEELLYKREQTLQALTCELEAYRHKMLTYGVMEEETNYAMDEMGAFYFDSPGYNYPPLTCHLNENRNNFEYEEDAADITHTLGHLKDLENKIQRTSEPDQLERDFSNTEDVPEKVIIDLSPRRSSDVKEFSTDSLSSLVCLSKEMIPDSDSKSPTKVDGGFMRRNCEKEDPSNLRKTDTASEAGDDMSDRVYTVDYVHNEVPFSNVTETTPRKGVSDDSMSPPRNTFNISGVGDPDIQKLYSRLQALEADRESLRQALISMRTDNAQMVLLKEIAQHLCKKMTPERRLPVERPSILETFKSILMCVFSFIFWRSARRRKYTFGLSASNVGLRMLLDKGPRTRQWRCLLSTQV